MKEIDVQREGSPKQMVPGEDNAEFLGCDKLWYVAVVCLSSFFKTLTFPRFRDRVQQSGKAESEMDDLCSQLKSKAKCSGKGAVIHQKDVDEILGPAPTDQNDTLKMFS